MKKTTSQHISDIFFWLDFPSPHIMPLVMEIGSLGYNVVVVCEHGIPERRQNLGWKEFSVKDQVPVIISPSDAVYESIIEKAGRQSSVNILYGMSAFPLSCKAFKSLKSKPCKIGLFLESYRNDQKLKSSIRQIFYLLQSFRYFRVVDFLLACGKLGVRSYSKTLFPTGRIYEFGYFVEGSSDVEDGDVGLEYNSEQAFSFSYVGQLNHHKNLKILLDGLSFVLGDFHLKIIGDGPLRGELEDYVAKKKLSEKVDFLGVVDNREVRKALKKSDCMVLPSSYDGWGAVINEALSSGCKVIVSSNCGASSVICDNKLGEVFSSNDVHELTFSLKKVMRAGKLSEEDREYIKSFYNRCLSPAVGAEHFMNIIKLAGVCSKSIYPPWSGRS
ncbi:glycosyltransferase [Halomonas mongoliensis]|uniref:glycosyltransferase n=1 Tax=Halomonas mongoliensis TaxID=321265 RepID=UPI00403B2B3C